MQFHKLTGRAEQPTKADKSAPTGFRGIFLKPLIGGGHGVVIRAPLRFAEAPTAYPFRFCHPLLFDRLPTNTSYALGYLTSGVEKGSGD